MYMCGMFNLKKIVFIFIYVVEVVTRRFNIPENLLHPDLAVADDGSPLKGKS